MEGRLKKGTLRRWRLPAIVLGAACVLLAAVIIHRNLSGPVWFVEAGL
jgi:predicted membrane-bound dolichyl-phosphate-mannose-protein mannosyltransferase